MKSVNKLVALSLALTTSGTVFADLNPFIGRHHRSIPQFESGTSPAAEPAPAPAAAPVRSAPTKPAKTSATLVDKTMDTPDGKPGECYIRVLVAPAMTTATERVLSREESFELIEVPAVLETVEERTLARAASERQEVIPATYKEIEERILKTPAYTRQIPVAAKFETRTERVLVKPERSYWKKGAGPMQKFDGETGDIMCYVTDPAVYETISRRVVIAPASSTEEKIPAVYETVKRTVIDQPAQIRTIPIPAEYVMTPVQKVKSAARVEKRVIPAEYNTFTRQVPSGPGSLEWRRTLCETNVTPEVVADIQSALNTRGFNVGAVDGIYGKSTEKAVADFQGSKNLPQGGLTYETLAALSISK